MSRASESSDRRDARERQSDQGAILLILLLAVSCLAAIGLALTVAASTDLLVAGHFRDAHLSFYAADAGVERVLAELPRVGDWSEWLAGLGTSSFVDGPAGGPRAIPGGGTVDLGAVRNLANCGRRRDCTPAEMSLVTADRPWGPDNPHWQLVAYGPVNALLAPGRLRSPCYVVVMVADDPSENDRDPMRDGAGAANPGAGVMLVRAEGFGPGSARSVVELTVIREPPTSAGGSARVWVRSWKERRRP